MPLGDSLARPARTRAELRPLSGPGLWDATRVGLLETAELPTSGTRLLSHGRMNPAWRVETVDDYVYHASVSATQIVADCGEEALGSRGHLEPRHFRVSLQLRWFAGPIVSTWTADPLTPQRRSLMGPTRRLCSQNRGSRGP